MNFLRQLKQYLWSASSLQDDQPSKLQEELAKGLAKELGKELGKQLATELGKELAKHFEEASKRQEELAKQARDVQLQLHEEISTKFQQLSMQASSEMKSVSISKVGSRVATDVLVKLSVSVDDGNKVEPLVATVEEMGGSLPPFRMASYRDESEATKPALDHIEACLKMCSVTFGLGGLEMLDVHTNNHFFKLPVGDTIFRGGIDGAILPYGVMPCSAPRELRCVVELKHSKQHKELFTGNHGQNAGASSSAASGTTFNTVQGQVYIETLAASVFSEYPEVLVLLTDFDFNTLTRYKSGVITVWENVSFSKAICKMAEFLNRCEPKIGYTLDKALVRMPPAEVAAVQPTQQLRRKLRGNNLLLEQLDSVMDSGMSANERFVTALEFIRAHRQSDEVPDESSRGWQSMFG